MVKADPMRNYYADLKVSATATENEIRKAFRTLALQYHPDRNPGREAEFVVRFQEIQAAHEILCDPTQRAKYDAERRKYRTVSAPSNTPNTPRTRPPPPPRNAYTTTTPAGSYYRAPPPRPQAQRPPPPQHNNTYSTGADRFSTRNFRQPPTAQKPDTRAKDADARANVFTAWQKMKQPRGEDPRQHNPNAYSGAHTNAQNNPNGTPFGRSQSTRVPSSKQGFDPSTPGVDEGQARSSYRNYARPAPTPPSSTTPPKESHSEDVPYSEANRVRTPYYSHVAGERTSMFEGVGRSASVRNSPTYAHRASSSQDAGTYSDSGRKAQGARPNGTTNKTFAHGYPDSSDEESEPEVFTHSNKHRDPPAPPQATRPPPPTWAQGGFTTPDPKRQSNGATGNIPNSFKSRSEESINMKFSPSDWHGKFEGSSSYFAPNVQKGANGKGRASPTRGRASQRNATDRNPFSQPNPFAQAQANPIPPPPPGPPPGINFAPPPMAPHAAKFSPQDWQETFKDPNWVYNEKKETSPRRPSEATKRPKAQRKASVQQNGASKTQDKQDASRPKYQAFAEEPKNGDADAMDIDSGTSSSDDKSGAAAGPGAPKLNTGAKLNGFTTAPSSGTAKPPAKGLNGFGSDFIEPLVKPQNDGLGGMASVGDALPFNSEASNSHPIKANAAKSLKYPDVPKAPAVPAKLDLASANQYFESMASYVKSYRKYCNVLTGHFAARSAEMEDLDERFIRNRGETTNKLGFTSYMAKMEEDESVMETWKVAQEHHIIALQQCKDVRTKAQKAGGLDAVDGRRHSVQDAIEEMEKLTVNETLPTTYTSTKRQASGPTLGSRISSALRTATCSPTNFDGVDIEILNGRSTISFSSMNALETHVNSAFRSNADRPPALPPAPTKRLGDVHWRGNGYTPFTVEGGWPTEPPGGMQEKKLCRRRATLEYLRHGNLDYLYLVTCTGPNTNKKEWLERRAAISARGLDPQRQTGGSQLFPDQDVDGRDNARQSIASLNKMAKFPNESFGGVEIMKVPLDAQHGGRAIRGGDGGRRGA
ncbi:DNAJ domain containing protein [Stemphylium lycopersici]|uniref:DNAJ domain containing protein n=1 Tax=Stemphylium lycopersici TaxID=183478 RepID=A0A364MWN3_STELY|nr:DNAJ domain containing protein [Stemphylium lycopersici]